jgi:sugar O-acyltransferase (sialic acid O-acetyltransferase NeuD family)
MRILVIGAGGHAQVVADILLRMQEARQEVVPIGYVDDNPELEQTTLLGLPVLGKIADSTAIPHDAIIVAIGDNATRRQLFDRYRSEGEPFAIARHPSAVIAPDVQVGPGTTVCANAVVNPGSVVGANVILNTSCSVDHHNDIDDHVHIAPGVRLGGGVNIGRGSMIGIGATVMPYHSVGKWSVVSAGSLVHADVMDHVVVAGAPARAIRNLGLED